MDVDAAEAVDGARAKLLARACSLDEMDHTLDPRDRPPRSSWLCVCSKCGRVWVSVECSARTDMCIHTYARAHTHGAYPCCMFMKPTHTRVRQSHAPRPKHNTRPHSH